MYELCLLRPSVRDLLSVLFPPLPASHARTRARAHTHTHTHRVGVAFRLPHGLAHAALLTHAIEADKRGAPVTCPPNPRRRRRRR